MWFTLISFAFASSASVASDGSLRLEQDTVDKRNARVDAMLKLLENEEVQKLLTAVAGQGVINLRADLALSGHLSITDGGLEVFGGGDITVEDGNLMVSTGKMLDDGISGKGNIVVGKKNEISACKNCLVTGFGNTAGASYGNVMGIDQTVLGDHTTAIGGGHNVVSGHGSSIFGHAHGKSQGFDFATIMGGKGGQSEKHYTTTIGNATFDGTAYFEDIVVKDTTTTRAAYATEYAEVGMLTVHEHTQTKDLDTTGMATMQTLEVHTKTKSKTLDVTDNAYIEMASIGTSIAQTSKVTGTATIQTCDVTGDSTVRRNFHVEENVTISGDCMVSTEILTPILKATDTASIAKCEVADSLKVEGLFEAKGPSTTMGLTVNGKATTSDIEANGPVTLNRPLTVNMPSTFTNVKATGETELQSLEVKTTTTLADLAATGASALAALTVAGNAAFAQNISVADDIVTGTATVGKGTLNTLDVSGLGTFGTVSATLGSYGSLQSGPFSAHAITVSGDSTFQGAATVGGALSVDGLFEAKGPSTTKALTVNGKATTLDIEANGPVTLNRPLTVVGAATLATLGVSGEASAATLSVTGASNLQGATTVGAATVASLSVTGASSLAELQVNGAATCKAALTVEGLSTFQNNINVAGSSTFTGEATLNSDVTVAHHNILPVLEFAEQQMAAYAAAQAEGAASGGENPPAGSF